MKPKIVASPGFTSSCMARCQSMGTLCVELFCQTIYQNGFGSSDGVVHGAEGKKNGCAKRGISMYL
jgi:hypothetical protein